MTAWDAVDGAALSEEEVESLRHCPDCGHDWSGHVDPPLPFMTCGGTRGLRSVSGCRCTLTLADAAARIIAAHVEPVARDRDEARDRLAAVEATGWRNELRELQSFVLVETEHLPTVNAVAALRGRLSRALDAPAAAQPEPPYFVSHAVERALSEAARTGRDINIAGALYRKVNHGVAAQPEPDAAPTPTPECKAGDAR